MFSWFLDIIQSLFGGLVDAVFGIGAWVWAVAVDLAGAVASWAVSVLPMGLQDMLHSKPWEDFFDFVDLIDWFVPVYAVFLVVLPTLAMVGGIRLIRWSLAFVPRVFTGAD